jgi:type I restriction enzyme, S subunit
MMWQPYPRYLVAPDQWVERYPAHWVYKRAHFVLQSRRESVAPEDLEGQEVVHYSIPNVQEQGTGVLEDGDDIDSAKLVVTSPVLLVSKLNPYKITVCIANPHPDYLTVASDEFIPIVSDQFDLRYAYYVWSSDKLASRLTALTQSVTRSHQRVSPEDITKIPWAWPPARAAHDCFVLGPGDAADRCTDR